MKKICLIFLLVWSTSTTTFGQGEWTAYTTTGAISKIIRRGNTLWMAATGGLIQWNLADNTYIKYTTLDGLPSLYLRDMVMDSSGTLWICSEDGGVTAYDGKNWTSFSEPEGLPSEDVFCAEIDRQGNKWFGTMEGLVKYDGNNWVTFQKNEEPINCPIYDLVLDKKNAIWVASSSGLSTYQNSTWKFVDRRSAVTLTVDNENSLWLAGFGYVWKYDQTDWEFYSLGPLIEVDQVQTSAVDSTNIKWFGSYTGLWRFDDSTVVHFTTDDGLPYNSVTDIYVDSLNNKWIGTPRGFSKFDGQSWTNYNLKTEIRSLFRPNIPALAVDQKNRLWVSDYNFGVSVFDGNSWQNYNRTHGLFDDCINAIAADRQNNLWFGAESSSGISKFDGTTWTSFSTADGLIGNGITAIAADFDNTVWVGTTSGVCKYDSEMWQSCQNIPELGADRISDIAVDRLGCLWFASSTGLVKYDGNAWTKFNSENGLPADYVSSLSVDKSNNIWVISGGEVSMYDGSNWTHQPVSLLVGRDMAIDSSDVKWFCRGRHGIARFDGLTWTYFSQKETHWADDEIICVTVDAKNNKWFGTEAGGLLKYADFTDKVAPTPKPTHFTISGNYPNPFNAATQFEYTLPGQTAQPVEIKIFDVLGRQVKLLFHGMQPGGHHRISWDGTDANGNACVSGIYLVLFEVNRQRVLRKVSLIK